VAVLIPVAGGDLSLQEAQSDSDWAADEENRKSVSCGSLLVGGASQGFFVRGQATVSTSSAMAEFLGAGSTTNEGLGLKELFSEFGFQQTLILQVDSNAAIGMCHRRGLGRVRHLDVRFLALQELLRTGRLDGIQKIDTEVNTADLGTKALNADRLWMLMEMLGYMDVSDSNMVGAVFPIKRQKTTSVESLACALVSALQQASQRR